MITIENISKSYGETKAVQDVSLTVEAGELFGLIGPDGAGKTTLFKILVTLLLPDAGCATVAGRDAVRDFRALRSVVGYMPGRFSLYPDLSVGENLQFFATVFGTSIAANYELIREIYVQLEPFKNRRAGALSGGMKQKLALCCALIHKPEVLFLDEPTTGVDAVSRKEFWDMLGNLKERGLTILVSTPYMDEASLCDRIALMQTGKVLAIDTPTGVEQLFDKPLFAVKANDRYRLIQDLRKAPFTVTCYA
ncbi:ABC transporter ATP-binding protein, partial [Persicitalea sp.]|uniref:ABC transporter ATP-binding protein n=1 Tax=Persicitalea sp. TaxID=3100273 RepID=UPI0035933324